MNTLTNEDSNMVANAIIHAATQHYQQLTDELTWPSNIYRPRLTIDGDQWCALYGDSLEDGVAGFGSSPHAAYRDFNKQWYTELAVNAAQRGKENT